jgi:YD repeat-containing protein
MSRTYNNQGIGIVGWSGNGWTHSYDAAIKVINASAVLVQRPEGKRYFYILVNGVWTSDSDMPWVLTQQKDAGGATTSWSLSTKNDQIETYDASGKLSSIKLPSGITQTLTYTSSLLTKVTDTFGNSLNFTDNSSGQMATLTDPAGNVYRYGYDASGNLKTVTYPDDDTDPNNNPVKTYVYGSDTIDGTPETVNTAGVLQPNALTGILDEGGVRYATYKYDANGKAISTEHAGGVEKYSLAYAPDGSSTSVTDPQGQLARTQGKVYDALNRLQDVTTPQ